MFWIFGSSKRAEPRWDVFDFAVRGRDQETFKITIQNKGHFLAFEIFVELKDVVGRLGVSYSLRHVLFAKFKMIFESVFRPMTRQAIGTYQCSMFVVVPVSDKGREFSN
jgi:hypothetical protein